MYKYQVCGSACTLSTHSTEQTGIGKGVVVNVGRGVKVVVGKILSDSGAFKNTVW